MKKKSGGIDAARGGIPERQDRETLRSTSSGSGSKHASDSRSTITSNVNLEQIPIPSSSHGVKIKKYLHIRLLRRSNEHSIWHIMFNAVEHSTNSSMKALSKLTVEDWEKIWRH